MFWLNVVLDLLVSNFANFNRRWRCNWTRNIIWSNQPKPRKSLMNRAFFVIIASRAKRFICSRIFKVKKSGKLRLESLNDTCSRFQKSIKKILKMSNWPIIEVSNWTQLWQSPAKWRRPVSFSHGHRGEILESLWDTKSTLSLVTSKVRTPSANRSTLYQFSQKWNERAPTYHKFLPSRIFACILVMPENRAQIIKKQQVR